VIPQAPGLAGDLQALDVRVAGGAARVDIEALEQARRFRGEPLVEAAETPARVPERFPGEARAHLLEERVARERECCDHRDPIVPLRLEAVAVAEQDLLGRQDAASRRRAAAIAAP
jgi:hypothetical protein